MKEGRQEEFHSRPVFFSSSLRVFQNAKSTSNTNSKLHCTEDKKTSAKKTLKKAHRRRSHWVESDKFHCQSIEEANDWQLATRHKRPARKLGDRANVQQNKGRKFYGHGKPVFLLLAMCASTCSPRGVITLGSRFFLCAGCIIIVVRLKLYAIYGLYRFINSTVDSTQPWHIKYQFIIPESSKNCASEFTRTTIEPIGDEAKRSKIVPSGSCSMFCEMLIDLSGASSASPSPSRTYSLGNLFFLIVVVVPSLTDRLTQNCRRVIVRLWFWCVMC